MTNSTRERLDTFVLWLHEMARYTSMSTDIEFKQTRELVISAMLELIAFSDELPNTLAYSLGLIDERNL